MTPKEFYDKVVYMRHCQRNYYAARRKKDAEKQRYYLGLSIPIENEIDAEIERVQKIQASNEANSNNH